MGSKGDSYDNALAEALNSLYKAELIRNRHYLDDHGPWEGIEDVELATAQWVQLVGHSPPSLRHRHARPDRARAGIHPTTTRRHQHRHRQR